MCRSLTSRPQGLENHASQPWQPAGAAVAGQCGERLGGGDAYFATAKDFHGVVVGSIDLLAVLAVVGEQRRLLLVAARRDVHISGRCKAHGLAAAVDLEKVK